MLGYMKSYGVLDLISSGSSPTFNTGYDVTRLPQDCMTLLLGEGSKVKVERVHVAPLEDLLSQGYHIVKCAKYVRCIEV